MNYCRITCSVVLLLSVSCTAGSDATRIVIDPDVTYQTLEGYGHGNMEQYTPKWYQQYGPSGVEPILDTLYAFKDNGLGLNIYRYPMPAADDPDHNHMERLPKNANKPFEYDDGKFNWKGHEDVLWMGKGAAERGVKLWASWYGFPYWLSTSECSAGSVDGKTNNLIVGKEARFIQHVSDVMKHFRDHWQMEFDWINPINEPEADWWKSGGGQPGSYVSPAQAITLYRELDKALKANGFDAKIIAYDAAYTNGTEYLDVLLDSDIQTKMDVLACHQYITTKKAMKNWAARAKQYNKSLWMTEWGDWKNLENTNEVQVKQMMNYANKLHEAFDVLNANAWVMWEAGFIFNTEKAGLQKRKAYWAVAHYSRHARPGCKRIKADSVDNKIKVTAWIQKEDPELPEKLVLVAVNSGEEGFQTAFDLSAFKDVGLQKVLQTSAEKNYDEISSRVEDSVLKIQLPKKSITTIELVLVKIKMVEK